jgi:osmotically-inducible protein OsmY
MKSDQQIQKDVLAELAWESCVNATHIGVEVDHGVVTLSGHVESFAEKWGAERATKRVSGVRAVAIEMDVKLKDASKRTDSDIALSAVNALEWQSNVPKNAIQISVENATITLSGEVTWDHQREAATAAVRHLLGVRGIVNQILVKPKVSLTAVKADIEAALKRRAYLDAQEINVSISADTVTLSGKVHSWSEKNLAINSAWSTPGVRSVIDKLVFA